MNEELLAKAIENGNVEMVRMLLEKNEKKEKSLRENKKAFEEECAKSNDDNQDGAANGKIATHTQH